MPKFKEIYCTQCWNFIFNCDCVFSYGIDGQVDHTMEDENDSDSDSDDDESNHNPNNDHINIVTPEKPSRPNFDRPLNDVVTPSPPKRPKPNTEDPAARSVPPITSVVRPNGYMLQFTDNPSMQQMFDYGMPLPPKGMLTYTDSRGVEHYTPNMQTWYNSEFTNWYLSLPPDAPVWSDCLVVDPSGNEVMYHNRGDHYAFSDINGQWNKLPIAPTEHMYYHPELYFDPHPTYKKQGVFKWNHPPPSSSKGRNISRVPVLGKPPPYIFADIDDDEIGDFIPLQLISPDQAPVVEVPPVEDDDSETPVTTPPPIVVTGPTPPPDIIPFTNSVMQDITFGVYQSFQFIHPLDTPNADAFFFPQIEWLLDGPTADGLTPAVGIQRLSCYKERTGVAGRMHACFICIANEDTMGEFLEVNFSPRIPHTGMVRMKQRGFNYGGWTNDGIQQTSMVFENPTVIYFTPYRLGINYFPVSFNLIQDSPIDGIYDILMYGPFDQFFDLKNSGMSSWRMEPTSTGSKYTSQQGVTPQGLTKTIVTEDGPGNRFATSLLRIPAAYPQLRIPAVLLLKSFLEIRQSETSTLMNNKRYAVPKSENKISPYLTQFVSVNSASRTLFLRHTAATEFELEGFLINERTVL